MGLQILKGNTLKKMFYGGAALLKEEKEIINALNVFPVPDGDTGTNMFLTLSYAVEQLNGSDKDRVDEVAMSVAHSSLVGARGNSGVILSQLFRGFSKGLTGKKEVDVKGFAFALQEGVRTAYKAVMKPVEGTMLTVAREAAQKAIEDDERDFIVFLEKLNEKANMSLERTPELLPVLKESGVVDAGGKGLCIIYEGFLKAIKGYNFDLTEGVEEEVKELERDKVAVKGLTGVMDFHSPPGLRYKYCTEFILKGKNLDSEEIKKKLDKMGDSLLVVGNGSMLKIHIHSNNPGNVLETCLFKGDLSNIKIDNMEEQQQGNRGLYQKSEESITLKEKISNDAEVGEKFQEQEIQVIAVSPGDGITEIFSSLGVFQVIEGGQTMNPSTDDFLKALEKTDAQKVVLLPNNKNIILAAEQTRNLSPRDIEVVPSTTVPQGICALMRFNPLEKDLKLVAHEMKESLGQVKTGQITFAVRDSTYNDIPIKNGSVIGLRENNLEVVEETPSQTVLSLIESMMGDEDEVITLYFGKDVTEGEAHKLVEELESLYPGVEVECYWGGQPLYYYYISIE
ncbi:MAG: DAK2 domain-containing protein [Candidatus Syntrophonatronum acetioxidans]|uniref:DAK2 domain-containing protein n=1 Tax=Candidatus Syntrophonatronum acetioxidans TaxID=1795816 RepID=A0A424YHS0_9FIRM|nr:MAG: DAK2 domain-containing protein [Candidatus Syntrophonatronum acetioxidans]